MGLADLLKRRLGRGAALPEAKRLKQGGQPAPPPAVPTPDELDALRAKNTRTARRKLRQAALAAQRQQPAQGGAAANRAVQRPPAAQAGAEQSQSESGDDEGAEAPLAPAPSGAYEALLASLKGSSDAFAQAYEQRQRELAGDSGASDDGGGGGAGGSEDGGEEESDVDDGSGGELSGEREEDLGGEAGGSDDAGSDGGAGEGGDAGSDEFVEGAGPSSAAADSSSSEGASEEEDEAGDAGRGGPNRTAAEQQRTRAAAGLKQRRETVGASEGAAARVDHFDAHLDAELTDEQVAALAEGRCAYADAPAHLQQWLPSARVQCSRACRLPAAAPAELAAYGVKERLITRWRDVRAGDAAEGGALPAEGAGAAAAGGGDGQSGKGAAAPHGDFVDGQQRALFALLSSYCDVLHPCRPYPTSPDAPDPEMDAVLLHVLNHCARTADRIKRNNKRLAAAAGGGSAGAAADPPRDQGFTRPKALLLLPMRNAALRCVLRLAALAVKETRTDTIQHKRRLLEEFGGGEEGEEEEEAALSSRTRAALARKPPEHRALFAGNLDDHFKLGVKLTRGAVRLYTDFYQSDILVASPLALAAQLGEARGGADAAGAADFLSSVEIVVVERADVMQMQNWAHVASVLAALNRLPHAQHDVDIMRVRPWALAGQARHYRQTVVLSGHGSPEVNALMARGCANHAGVARLLAEHKGVLSRVVPQVRQIFERLPTVPGGPAAAADARFEYFKAKVWPRIREAARGGGQLLYVPSYFDYVRVRNYLRAQSASFLGLCEYTDRADMARARAYFADGRHRVLLYTERAQFYNRHRLRGVRDVVFYQLPEHAAFYPEVVNWLEEESAPAAELATTTVLYGRYDALRLQRVVGSARSARMLRSSAAGTFLFC